MLESHNFHTDARRRPAARLVAAAAAALSVVAGLLGASPAAAAAPRPIVTGWLPYWTTASSLADLKANADLFTEASPFWYSLQWNSSTSTSRIATQVSDSSKTLLKGGAAASRVALWPTFTDGMPARQLAAVMKNPAQRAALVSRIVSVAISEGYAGIDLDFERFAFSDGSATWSMTRPAWVAFVAQLAASLHAHGKKLAVTTPPIYSATSGYWVYDWKGIGPYVDRLRIMAYDYSFDAPGPIAPFPWAQNLVRFAITQLPSGKVQLGVATYGRDWVRRDANNRLMITGTCPTGTDLRTHEFDSVNLPAVLAARGLTMANVAWSATYKENYYYWSRTYVGKVGEKSATCTVNHVGWFDGAASVAARATLVGTYQLAGIAAWTIGGEDHRQWAALRAYATTIAPSPTLAITKASSVVRHGRRLTVSANASSRSLPVTGARVTLQWLPKGGKRWTSIATSVTNFGGHAYWRPVMVASGSFRTAVAGSWGRAPGLSASRIIRVVR